MDDLSPMSHGYTVCSKHVAKYLNGSQEHQNHNQLGWQTHMIQVTAVHQWQLDALSGSEGKEASAL